LFLAIFESVWTTPTCLTSTGFEIFSITLPSRTAYAVTV
jgi:hypothetical protein